MFLLRQGSRNQMNSNSQGGKFQYNIMKLLNIDIPHFDTVNKFLKRLGTYFLEQTKRKMLQIIISRKVLSKFRLLGKYYIVSVDGVNIYTSDTKPYENCPFRIFNKDKKVYFVNVLEAKLVCSNGFSLSIGSEWLRNKGEYDKQDCEKKAFTRLVKKLKRDYPKLPICFVTDGLFVGEPNIKLCNKLDFRYIFTLQDGSIPDMHQDFDFRKRAEKSKHTKIKHFATKNEIYYLEYFFSNDIHYRKNDIDMFQVLETVCSKKSGKITNKKFLYVTDIDVEHKNIEELVRAGRMRWKIENEGFNTQKNLGYSLKHKFSRNDFAAMQNYYQCMQIAHIIEQLLVKSELGKNIIGKKTLIWVWDVISAFIKIGVLDIEDITNELNIKKQYIY